MIFYIAKGSSGKTVAMRTVSFSTSQDILNACAMFGCRDKTLDGSERFLPAANYLGQFNNISIDGVLRLSKLTIGVDKNEPLYAQIVSSSSEVLKKYVTIVSYAGTSYLASAAHAHRIYSILNADKIDTIILSKKVLTDPTKRTYIDVAVALVLIGQDGTAYACAVPLSSLVSHKALSAEGFPYISVGESGVLAPTSCIHSNKIYDEDIDVDDRDNWFVLNNIVKRSLTMQLRGYFIDSVTSDVLSSSGSSIAYGASIDLMGDLYSANQIMSIGSYTPILTERDPIGSLEMTGFVYGFLRVDKLSKAGYFDPDSTMEITSRRLGLVAKPGSLYNGHPLRDLFFYIYKDYVTYGAKYRYDHRRGQLVEDNREESELNFTVKLSGGYKGDGYGDVSVVRDISSL